jgi:hypothetical protein
MGTRPVAPWHTTDRTCLRGFRQRRSPRDATNHHDGGAVKPQARVDPNLPRSATCSRPIRPAAVAACADTTTNIRPDRSDIPCRSTALAGHLPSGMTDRPGPGVAREQNQTFARPPHLPGKTPRPDRQPGSPKAVRPEEIPIIPEDRSPCFIHHRPLRTWRLGSGIQAGVAVFYRSPVLSRADETLAKIAIRLNNKKARNRSFLLIKYSVPHNSCDTYPRDFPQPFSSAFRGFLAKPRIGQGDSAPTGVCED